MMHTVRKALCVGLVLLCAVSTLATAAEFSSVAEPAAVLYDAPSKAAKPIIVLSRLYPVEIIVKLESWTKVRDHTGALGWIEKQQLSDARMVLVTAPSAPVHERPEDTAPVVFVAAQFVALELLQIGEGGWIRVRHADGPSGYLRAQSIWGS